MSRKPADSPGFAALPEIESSRHDGLCYLTGNIGPSLLSHQLASHCLKVTELGNNLQLFTFVSSADTFTRPGHWDPRYAESSLSSSMGTSPAP